MAEKKFQVGPPETTTLPNFPLYKEKLLTKCLKDAKKNKHNFSGALDSRRWRFLNVGLNDFRDGYPTPVGKDTLIQGQRGVSPDIFGISPPITSSDKAPRKRFSKKQACFSKQNPLQQSQREHVAALEHKLKQHPLVLYPHREQSMPPELFDQVISVLDPDMCVNKDSTMISPEKEECEEREEENVDGCTEWREPATQKAETEEDVREGPSANQIRLDNSGLKNPYKGLQTRMGSAKDDQKVNVKSLRSPSQDEDIKKVTNLLCDWVTSLGGENNNLNESTLLGIFVSGYEKKPSLSFPIKVVEPINVPEELRKSFVDLHREHTQKTLLKDSEPHKSQPGTKKPIYGAWYLDPKKWKERDAGEPLRDPEAIPEDLFSGHPSEMDEELKQMHGTQAFKQYIISNGQRMPRFLSSLFSEDEGEHRPRGAPDAVGSGSTRKGTVVL